MPKREYEYSITDLIWLLLGPFLSLAVGLLFVKVLFCYFSW